MRKSRVANPQHMRIAAYLLRHNCRAKAGDLTRWSATNNILNPRGRISDLRAQGFVIRAEQVPGHPFQNTYHLENIPPSHYTYFTNLGLDPTQAHAA